MRFFSILLVMCSGFAAQANQVDVSNLTIGASGSLDYHGFDFLTYATMTCVDLESREVTKQTGLIGAKPSAQGLMAVVKRLTVVGPAMVSPVDSNTLVSFKSDDLDQSRKAVCRLDITASDVATSVIMDSQLNQ